VFDSYPITIYNIRLNSKIVGVVGKTIQGIAAASQFVLLATLFTNPSISTILIKMLSSFFFLLLLNTPELVYPFLILLSSINLNIVPDRFTGYLKDYAGQSECTPNEIFVKRELECNLLSNYGEDIIIIYS